MEKMRLSFRCYYNGDYSQHYQDLHLEDIPKWIEAYRFTHPNVKGITVAISFDRDEKENAT